MQTRSSVLEHIAPPQEAARHFRSRLSYEADCADVAADLAAGAASLILVDCRGPRAFGVAHLPGAVNIPHRRITARLIEKLIPDESTLIVTYCNGPHCNASTRGALRFAELGRRVKEMPGGLHGWAAEGLPIETSQPEPSRT